MSERGQCLREVMARTRTSQSQLSRLSGVRQPSISQFLSGKVECSDGQLDRLLSCMGYRLEVVRQASRPTLMRSEQRSWQLHRRLSAQLSPAVFELWRPTMLGNIERLGTRVQGEPHKGNLARWEAMVRQEDLAGLRRVLTGLDRGSIEMREVSPMSGLLSEQERLAALAAR